MSARTVLLVGLPAELSTSVARMLDGWDVTLAADAASSITHLAASPNIVVVDTAVIAASAVRRAAEITESAGADGPAIVVRIARDAVVARHPLREHPAIAAVIEPEADASSIAATLRALLPDEPVEVDEPAPVDGTIAKLWQRSRQVMLERVGVLEQAVAGLLAGTLHADELREAERTAHRVAGSAGTFGFAAASRIARQLETSLQGDSLASGHAAAQLVVALRDSFDADATTDETPRELVVVDCDEPGLRRALLDTLVQQGLAAVAWDQEPAVISPRAVIVHLRDEASCTRLVRAIPPQSRTPVIALVDPNGPFDRLVASRAGAHVVVDVATRADRIVAALAERLDHPTARSEHATIAVVDDDELAHDAFRVFAAASGWKMVHFVDPREVVPALSESPVDLVVVDAKMPGIDGFTLTRMIRSDAQLARLPVVFLTAHVDPATLHRAFAAGADDFLAKPLEQAEATSRLTRILERGAGTQAPTAVDALTGMARRETFEDAGERLIDEQRRVDGPVAVVLLKVIGLDEVNRDEGEHVGDALLRRLAHELDVERRGDEFIGRVAGAQFAMILGGSTSSDATQRIADVLTRVRRGDVPKPIRLSVGVAQRPADGESLVELLRSARHAADAASARPGDHISVAGESRMTTYDVVVVEDDPALSSLIEHALRARGLTVAVIADGATAIDALASTSGGLVTELVLLDVDLPGASGLDVLRQLRRSGVLTDTKVMMLTVRTSESEVLEAFTLGAIDHVAKPFSLPVLVERVRRALDR